MRIFFILCMVALALLGVLLYFNIHWMLHLPLFVAIGILELLLLNGFEAAWRVTSKRKLAAKQREEQEEERQRDLECQRQQQEAAECAKQQKKREKEEQ